MFVGISSGKRYAKQKHLGCKKVQGQEESALISNKAKKSVNESAT